MTADQPALTRKQAAAALKVSPARICQLLASKNLDGPKGAPWEPRVWQSSLEMHKANNPLVGARRRRKSERDAELAERVSALESIVGTSERSTTSAVMEMKVELDKMREQLKRANGGKARAERISSQLLGLLQNLDISLSALQRKAEGDQALLRGNSND